MDQDARDPSPGTADATSPIHDGPVPPEPGDGGHFWNGVRVLGIAAIQLAAVAGAELLCVTATKSLREPAGLRQAAITVPVAFLLLLYTAAAWAGQPKERLWLRLGPPSRDAWGDILGILGLGAAAIIALGLLAAHLPGFEEAMRRQQGFVSWRTPAQLAAALALLALCPAISEELYFRGLLLHRLAGPWGPAAGAAAQALLFAALHGPAWPVALGIGLVNAALTLRSGSLWPGIVLHCLNNCAVVLSAGPGR